MGVRLLYSGCLCVSPIDTARTVLLSDRSIDLNGPKISLFVDFLRPFGLTYSVCSEFQIGQDTLHACLLTLASPPEMSPKDTAKWGTPHESFGCQDGFLLQKVANLHPVKSTGRLRGTFRTPNK